LHFLLRFAKQLRNIKVSFRFELVIVEKIVQPMCVFAKMEVLLHATFGTWHDIHPLTANRNTFCHDIDVVGIALVIRPKPQTPR